MREVAESACPKGTFAETELGVVLSHDCDLARGPEKEPWVEIIVVRPIEGPAQGSQTRMKNPRVLDFHGRLDGTPITGRVLAADRNLIPKAHLAGRSPSAFLETDPAGLLAAWIARRYIREAFPTEFDRRWSSARKAIRDHLRATGEYLEAIYLRLDERELGPDEKYVVLARGSMLSDDYLDSDRRTRAQEALDGAMALLGRCAGIDVDEWALLSEADLSLDDVRLLKALGFVRRGQLLGGRLTRGVSHRVVGFEQRS
jgi:hypothetical protein